MPDVIAARGNPKVPRIPAVPGRVPVDPIEA